jgi:beta-lactamase superfamily II metal-dependent hydrolase
VLKKLVRGSGARVVNPTTGMKLGLDMMYLDIVWPNKGFIDDKVAYISPSSGSNVLGAYTSNLDPNEFSVVAILSFGNFKGIFTGDIGPDTEKNILAENVIKPVNYIKIPHHGSKNGLTEDFLKVLNPQIAVISVGKKNSYGHPNQEILDMLSNYGVKTFRTDEMGDVEVVSDGVKIWKLAD